MSSSTSGTGTGTDGASSATGTGDASTGGTGTASIPTYADILSKMEYGDNSTDASKLNAIITANPTLFELPADAIDNNALNCSVSAPVNFLYLPTIRGGRKMSSDMNEANNMSGGGCGCGMSGGGCGCGIKGGKVMSGEVMSGGCFTCKKGVKNITLIYSGIHIIIPKLYSKYHAEKAAKKPKTAKAVKTAKAAIKKAKTV